MTSSGHTIYPSFSHQEPEYSCQNHVYSSWFFRKITQVLWRNSHNFLKNFTLPHSKCFPMMISPHNHSCFPWICNRRSKYQLLEHNCAAKDLEKFTIKRFLVVQARWIHDEQWETKKRKKNYSSTLGQSKV
jgi:hypothetical protein